MIGQNLQLWYEYYLLRYILCIAETIAFVGSHLDVVPANPANWDRNPFKLVVEVTIIIIISLY